MTTISFENYVFRFWVLTPANVYEPSKLRISTSGKNTIASSSELTYGDGSGSVPGELKVVFSRTSRGISWSASASTPELIKGIKVAIEPLPLGTLMVPLGHSVNLQPDEPGRAFVFPGGYYPRRHTSGTGVTPASGPLPIWAAQFALLRSGDHTLYLHGEQYPPHVKKLWIYREGDHQTLHLYDEALGCQRATNFSTTVWYLETVADWQRAVDEYTAWMSSAYGLRSFAERSDVQPWLKDLGLVVLLHGIGTNNHVGYTFVEMAEQLTRLADRFPSQRMLVKVLGFEGRIDNTWPDNTPAEQLGGVSGFEHLASTCRQLGIHLMPHLNVWGASYANPTTESLLPYRILDLEGRPVTWSFDRDGDEIDEEIFAYISPDAPEFRQVMRTKVSEIVNRGVDAVFLDQTGTFVNDLRYDHFQGLQALYTELRRAMPGIQFVGEGPTTELSVSLCPLLAGVSASEDDDQVELYLRLFGRFVRQHNHSASFPPEPYHGVWSTSTIRGWTEERFARQQQLTARATGVPTLNLTDRRIDPDGPRVEMVLAQARDYIGKRLLS
jgi:hypothetical protein